MKRKLLLFLLFSSLFFCFPSLALKIPNQPGGYINDYAKMLSLQATNQISTELRNYENETSNQIVIATFNSLDGESLEDFSIKLAEKWKIGTKEKDNGVILLIFKEDKEVRIEVGYGLEGVLTDAICSQIIRNDIVPSFKAGNYDLGVEKAINSIIKVTKNEYKSSNKTIEKVTPSMISFLVTYGLFILFFVLIFFIAVPMMVYAMIVAASLVYIGKVKGLLFSLPIIFLLELFRRKVLVPMFGETLTSTRTGGRWTDGFGGGGFSSGGFGGGGFSGGGGSFGGGGSSGRW